MGKEVLIAACALPLILALSVSSHAWPIPDTGQTKCYTNTSEIPCPQPGDAFYGQDGNYTINPPSYTKLDANGNDLPDSATSWIMVHDNVTGLLWEMKDSLDGVQDYSNPHDADNTYTWYDSNPAINGGQAGTPGDGTDTEDFINALNASNFGGYSDWCLPTKKELPTIVDFSSFNPAINITYFPNTVSSGYWSSTTYVDNANYTWYMDFSGGYDDWAYGAKSRAQYVRAVRGGQTSNHFINNGDGTITDMSTGLMWQQATAPGECSWELALSYCENLTLAGHLDWRLPTIKELDSVVDPTRVDLAIDTTYFPDTMASGYWSSTTLADLTQLAWGMNFRFGQEAYNYHKLNLFYVRAVRSGQNRLLGNLVILTPAQAGHWSIGSQETVTWDTAGIAGNVSISISRDGGKTYRVISSSTPNGGSFPWTVTGPASVNCMLKVEPLDDPMKAAVQGIFTIAPSNPIVNDQGMFFIIPSKRGGSAVIYLE